MGRMGLGRAPGKDAGPRGSAAGSVEVPEAVPPQPLGCPLPCWAVHGAVRPSRDRGIGAGGGGTGAARGSSERAGRTGCCSS